MKCCVCSGCVELHPFSSDTWQAGVSRVRVAFISFKTNLLNSAIEMEQVLFLLFKRVCKKIQAHSVGKAQSSFLSTFDSVRRKKEGRSDELKVKVTIPYHSRQSYIRADGRKEQVDPCQHCTGYQ